MTDKKHPSEESGSGQLDYGANKPTGGTNANVGKINPQSPTSGTENNAPETESTGPASPNASARRARTRRSHVRRAA